MSKYGKTVWTLMSQAAAQLPEPFSKQQIIQWFLINYPQVPQSTLRAHIVSCCVNDRNRRHHRPHSGKDILYKSGKDLYLRYNPSVHGAFDREGNLVTPPQQPVPTQQSPASQTVISGSISNRSRHDDFVHQFNDLGRSLKYNTQSTQAPFRHDVVWRRGSREPSIVIEVCDGGSLDKDLASLQWAVNPANWGAIGILVLNQSDRQRALSRLGASNQVFVVPFDTAENLCELIQSCGDLIRLIL